MHHMLSEPMEQAVDRLRQRHFTYEEITGISSSSRRMHMGVDVVEKLKPVEEELAARAVAHAENLAEAGDRQKAILREALLIALRQAALAMALNDYTRLGDVLCNLQKPLAEARVPAEIADAAAERLRDDVLELLPPLHGRRFNELLRPALRFVSNSCEVACNRDVILDGLMETLGAQFPDLEKRFVNSRAKITEDLDLYLTWTLRGILPDGPKRVWTLLRNHLNAVMKYRYGAEVMKAAADALTDLSAKHLSPSRSMEFQHELKPFANFLVVSADVADGLEEIMTACVRELTSRYPELPQKYEKFDELVRRDMTMMLRYAVYGTHEAGEEAMIEALCEFNQTLEYKQFPPRVIIDAYQILLEVCRERLSAQSVVVLEQRLNRIAHFNALSADLADKRDPLLKQIANSLAEKYPEYFKRHQSDVPYIVRDHQQVLFNAALGMLPGGWKWAVGRFQVFGEFLAQARFNKSMMYDAFAMLEESLLANLESQSISCLLPRWRKLRAYLEACSSLAFVQDEILKEAHEAVSAKFAAEFAKYPGGAAKVPRDLKTMLHTAMIAMIPEGNRVYARGIWNFHENILEVQMNPAMLDTAYGSLAKAVKKHLDVPATPEIVSLIEKGRDSVYAAAKLAPAMDGIISETVSSVMKSYTSDAERYRSASRRTAEDFELVIRHSLLATIPGGEHMLANGMNQFAESIWRSGFSAEMLTSAYAELRKAVSKALDRHAGSALNPVLEQVTLSIQALGELNQHRDEIIEKSIREIEAKHAAEIAKYPQGTAKMRHDFSKVLLYAGVSLSPGGQRYLVRVAQTIGTVAMRSNFDPKFMHDCYDTLGSMAGGFLSRPVRKPVLRVIESMRDCMMVAGALGRTEKQILEETISQILLKHDAAVRSAPHLRHEALTESRNLLHSSLFAELPGGDEEFAEALAELAAATEHRNGEGAVMIDGYRLLTETTAKHLNAAGGQRLAGTLKNSLRTLSAAGGH